MEISNFKKIFPRKVILFIVVSIALLITAVAYSYYPAHSIRNNVIKFNSPDETAAYFFTKHYAETGQLTVDEPLLAENGGHIHPRSITAIGNKLAPVTFLGLPVIYGTIGQLIGVGAIPYMTPVFAVIALIFFYILIRRLFDLRIALVSATLLGTHPAFWYNASRSMMPNVPFTSFLIIGLALLVISQTKIKKDDTSKKPRVVFYYIAALMAGLAVGASLTIRFSEIVWVSGLLGLWGLVSVRRIWWLRLVPFLAGLVIPILLFFAANKAIYGNILAGGYGLSASAGFTSQFITTGNLVSSGAWSNITQLVKTIPATLGSYVGLLLPFGYHPKEFIQNYSDYILKMFWWYIIPVMAGAFFALHNSFRSIAKKELPIPLAYTAIAATIGIWLVMFYGSWVFYDNISQEVTLGNSYIRYWLPLYTLAMPLAAYALVKLAGTGRLLGKISAIAIIAIMVIYGVQTTLWTNKESLFAIAKNIDTYHEISEKIVALTPSDAVIVSARSDKIVFPQRKVAVEYDFRELDLITPIAKTGAVYYYGLWSQKDGEYISKKYFEPHGLRMVYMQPIYANEYLYHVIPL